MNQAGAANLRGASAFFFCFVIVFCPVVVARVVARHIQFWLDKHIDLSVASGVVVCGGFSCAHAHQCIAMYSLRPARAAVVAQVEHSERVCVHFACH